MLCSNQAWGAASKIKRIDFFCCRGGGKGLNFSQDAFGVAICRIFMKGDADEVTIAAFAPTEWDVDIDA